MLMVYTLVFFCLHSCCPTRISNISKEHWREKINNEYSFPEREAPLANKIYLDEIKSEIAIFPKEYAMFSSIDLKNLYTPTLEDIKTAEKILSEMDSKKGISTTYEKYNKRQYLGYQTITGKKVLLINFLLIKNKCENKSQNSFLFDKYFLDMFHPNDQEESRRIILKKY
jgi:hypothetical protein